MKLTIGKKLSLAFGTILLLMLVSAVASNYKANEISRTQESMMQMRVPTGELIKDLQRDLNQTQNKGRQQSLLEPCQKEEMRRRNSMTAHGIAPIRILMSWHRSRPTGRVRKTETGLPLSRNNFPSCDKSRRNRWPWQRAEIGTR